MLKLSDVSKRGKYFNVSERMTSNAYPLQVRETATNKISYFKALATLESIPEELRPYMPLFCSVHHRFDMTVTL